MTALELCARNAHKVNECVKAFNELDKWTKSKIVELFNVELPGHVHNWLDAHPEVTTTLQDGEILWEKLHETLRHRTGNNHVTPQMFGAVGDGTADDTDAVQDAVDYAHNAGYVLYFPAGTYLVTRPITVPGNMEIYGLDAVVTKTNNTTVQVDGTAVNCIFAVSGSKTYMHDLKLTGSISAGVAGIAFDNNVLMSSFNRITIAECYRAFNDVGGMWMCEFDRVHCITCEKAFDFSTKREKTSLVFKACWAENCGQAYHFERCHYTNLISCGADWCNSGVFSPYDKGIGNMATNRGVYHFELCRAVTMNGCGVENCWGNGAVYCSATFLTINGLTCTNVKSTFQVDPEHFVPGMVVHDGEASRIFINGLFANNAFENGYVSATYPGTVQPLIAYNYSNKVYGDRHSKGIIAIALHAVSGELLGGSGKYDKEVLLLDFYGDVIRAEEYFEVDHRKIYPCKILHSDTETAKITFPFVGQSGHNRCHLIKVIGHNNAPNDNRPWPFEFTLSVASLNDVNHATLVNPSDPAMTVECNGLNAVVTLPQVYTDVLMSVDVISEKNELIDIDNIKLG